jgi:hypothetical protein
MLMMIALPVALLAGQLARQRGYSMLFMPLSLILGILGIGAGIAATTTLYGSFKAALDDRESANVAMILLGVGALLGSGSVCVWVCCLPIRVRESRPASGRRISRLEEAPPSEPEAERDLVAEWRKAREAQNRPQE